MSAEFFIVDLRPEWLRNPYVTVWRPSNAGYAYPLPWAGRYSEPVVVKGGAYYSRSEGRRHVRFAVPCATVEALAEAPRPGMIDGDVGPVIPNTGAIRTKLRKARYRLPPNPAPSVSEERS